MGWGSDIKKAFNRAKDALRKADNALSQIRRIDGVIDEIQTARNWAGRRINVIDGQMARLPNTIEDKAREILPSLLEELAQAFTKEGLRRIRDGIRIADREIEALRQRKPELADALDIPGGTVTIGPMKLKYSGFFTRTAQLADSLDHYVNEPPEFRRGPLLQLIEALGPDSVDLGIDISAALLVVQSDTLSVGFSADELPMEVFVEVADTILEGIGVPE